MGKWKLERAPELVPVPIDPELHKQNLAEIAEILYPYFCQLDPKFQSLSKYPEPRNPNRPWQQGGSNR